MLKTFPLALFAVAMLSACGTTATKPSAQALPTGTQFSSPQIALNLSQRLTVEGYPDQKGLKSLMEEKAATAFKAENLIAPPNDPNALVVNIEVNYQRRFAGEDTPLPSKSVAQPIISYTIVISDHGVEKRRIEKSGLTVTQDFSGNLATVFTMGLGKTAKDEEKDIQLLAQDWAQQIKAL